MTKKNRIIFYKDFQYCFFTRNGGVSKKNFSSLNCAFNKGDKEIILSLIKCFKLLGINLNKNNDESDFVTKSEKKIIFDLIKEREEARKLKDYERADNIRDKLKEMNINIEDSLEGTKWIKNE